MSTTYKVLGQSAPAATTDTDVYTVPAATQSVISTITVCNRGSEQATYRIAIRPNGASQDNQHFIAFDAIIPANDMIALTIGITVDATDIITVRSSTANLSFNIFGSEIS